MQDFESLTDKVKRYLGGTLPDEEKRQFEKELEQNSELKEIVKDISSLKAGIEIQKALDDSHIDPEELALYAEDKSNYRDGKQAEIDDHLKSCSACQEEYAICRKTLTYVKNHEIVRETLFQKVVGFLFPKMETRGLSYKILAPAFVLTLMILISVPTYLLVKNDQNEDLTLVCRLTPNMRAVDNSTAFIVENSIDSIQFALDYPVPLNSQFLYNITIQNIDGENVFGQANLSREKAFAIKVPAHYFKPGFYTLTAEELEQGKIRRTIVFPFHLKMVD